MRFMILICGLLMSPWVGAQQVQCGPVTLDFAGGALQAQTVWTEGPEARTLSALRIEWKAADGKTPVDPGSFRVSPYMPAMGHGTNPTQIRRVLDAQGNPLLGVFDVGNIDLSMGGLWQIRVILTLPDGSKETQSFDVLLPESGDGGHHH